MDGHYSIGAWLIRNREPLCQCRAEFARVKVKSAHVGVMVWMAAELGDRTVGLRAPVDSSRHLLSSLRIVSIATFVYRRVSIRPKRTSDENIPCQLHGTSRLQTETDWQESARFLQWLGHVLEKGDLGRPIVLGEGRSVQSSWAWELLPTVAVVAGRCG